MSLFKIVGNYYEDILDYYTKEYKKLDPIYKPEQLEAEYLKYQDNPEASPVLARFKEKFYSIFDIPNYKLAKKTDIVRMLAMTYMRLDRLRESDLRYWAARKKMYTNLIIVMTIVLCILLWFILMYLRGISLADLEGGSSISRIKINIAYITVYTIIFSVFLVFLVNLGDLIKMATAVAKHHATQFTMYNLMFIPNIQLQMFLTALGYSIINDKNMANKIIKELTKMNKGDTKANSGENTMEAGCAVNTSSRVQAYVMSKDPCKNKTNLDEVYDDLKDDLRNYIFQFYMYGYGYTMVRRQIIKSSHNYMLREVRSNMVFYYYMVNRRGDYDIEKETIENTRKIIDKEIITRLDILQFDFFVQGNGNNADMLTMIAENEDPTKNPLFVASKETFANAIIYLAMFLYPLYIKKDPADISANPLFIYLPQHINDSDSNKFKSYTRDYFSKRLETLKEQIQTTQSATPSEFNTMMADFILNYKEFIQKQLMDLIATMRGNNMFVVDESYIKSIIDHMYTLVPLVNLDAAYKEIFREAMMKVLLPRLKQEIFSQIGVKDNENPTLQSLINFKVSLVVDTMAESLYTYKLNVRENMSYIMDEIIKNRKEDVQDNMLEIYKRILLKLDNAIEMKKKVNQEKDPDSRKFVSVAQFHTRVDDMIFTDLQKGFDTKYLYDLLNDFYMEVSGAVGTSSNTSTPENRTEHNIFYTKQKRFKLAYIAIIMIYVIVGELYGYYIISWSDNLSQLNKAKKLLVPGSADYKVLRSILRTKSINHYIKIFLVTSIALFICAMLFSYYKKATDAFEFNRDTIETNTSDFLNAVTKLDEQMNEIQAIVGENKMFARIQDIKEITDEMKSSLYTNIREAIDKYEKCNYIINVSQTQLPFPYTEVTLDIFMIFGVSMCFLYVMGQMKPLARIQKIKELQHKIANIMVEPDIETTQYIQLERACHYEDIDIVVFTLKIIFFSFLIMFLIFYTFNIITSTTEFKNGLYNSGYFEESRCYNG